LNSLIFFRKEKKLAKTLMKVLERARDAGRVRSGVFECATHLEEDPYRIMVCLLPVTAPTEVAMSIQHKLIEAYCLENDIQVVKVGSALCNNIRVSFFQVVFHLTSVKYILSNQQRFPL